jgi:hypothetical protein
LLLFSSSSRLCERKQTDKELSLGKSKFRNLFFFKGCFCLSINTKQTKMAAKKGSVIGLPKIKQSTNQTKMAAKKGSAISSLSWESVSACLGKPPIFPQTILKGCNVDRIFYNRHERDGSERMDIPRPGRTPPPPDCIPIHSKMLVSEWPHVGAAASVDAKEGLHEILRSQGIQTYGDINVINVVVCRREPTDHFHRSGLPEWDDLFIQRSPDRMHEWVIVTLSRGWAFPGDNGYDYDSRLFCRDDSGRYVRVQRWQFTAQQGVSPCPRVAFLPWVQQPFNVPVLISPSETQRTYLDLDGYEAQCHLLVSTGRIHDSVGLLYRRAPFLGRPLLVLVVLYLLGHPCVATGSQRVVCDCCNQQQ